MTQIKSMLDHTLTQPDQELSRKLSRTVPGMAHFAGTGPAGRTCGECAHLHEVKRHGRRINVCSKYAELMRQTVPSGREIPGAETNDVPMGTPACRYFWRVSEPDPS